LNINIVVSSFKILSHNFSTETITEVVNGTACSTAVTVLVTS